jgi:hypothetical protein
MTNYAVVEGTNVINTIVADSKEVAEEVTGKTCIEFTTEPAEAGGTYENGTFIRKKPFESWVLDEENNWKPPVEYPSNDPEHPKSYIWDEETINWIEV